VVGVLDSIKLDYQIDRSTGVITIADSLNLKPDYLLSPLTIEQQTLLEQQPFVLGVAIERDDYNEDSLDDFGVITADGFQKIYTVSDL
jgi:hypothetical protein